MSAKACPHCGAQRKRYGALKWVGVAFLALIVAGAVSQTNEPARKAVDTKGTQAASSSERAVAALPASQRDFLSVTADYKARFQSASNELQQNTLRDERRAALIKALRSQLAVENWVGTLRGLETNSEGKAIVTVRLASGVDILTWNNALSDVVDKTMIDKGTAVYSELMQMSVGDSVSVSGSFIPSDEDGVSETSVFIDGSMTAPEFLFHFSKIQKQ